MTTDSAPGRELVRLGADPILSKVEHNDLARIANTLAQSGVFPDVQSGQAAYAKILLGRSIGLGPMQSMTGIHLVKGNPQLAATTLAAFVRQSERYDYRVIEHTAERCVIEFGEGTAPGKLPASQWPQVQAGDTLAPMDKWEPWDGSLGLSEFTVEEAKKAGLGGAADKWDASQWGKWPRNMVFARAMSNGVKWYTPDLFGGVPVYTEADEFEARPSLSAGEGDGAPVGIELGPEVDAVIARAQEVGHAGLANRAAIEVQLGGRPEAVAEWVAKASAELDATEAAEPAPSGDVAEAEDDDDVVDAEVLPAPDDAEGWRQRSAEKLAEWEALTYHTTDEVKRLKHEADTALQTAMNIAESGGVEVGEIRKTEGGES